MPVRQRHSLLLIALGVPRNSDSLPHSGTD